MRRDATCVINMIRIYTSNRDIWISNMCICTLMIFLFIIRREIDPFPTSSIMALCLYDMGIAGTVLHALLALITVHFTFPFLFFLLFNSIASQPFPCLLYF